MQLLGFWPCLGAAEKRGFHDLLCLFVQEAAWPREQLTTRARKEGEAHSNHAESFCSAPRPPPCHRLDTAACLDLLEAQCARSCMFHISKPQTLFRRLKRPRTHKHPQHLKGRLASESLTNQKQ